MIEHTRGNTRGGNTKHETTLCHASASLINVRLIIQCNSLIARVTDVPSPFDLDLISFDMFPTRQTFNDLGQRLFKAERDNYVGL